MVVADYFSVILLMSYHRVAADRSEAAVKALTAGLDLELPALDCFGAPLKAAIGEGKVAMSVVDTAVRRVLTAKMRLGLFESPYVDSTRVKLVFADPANAHLARRAAIPALSLWPTTGCCPWRRTSPKWPSSVPRLTTGACCKATTTNLAQAGDRLADGHG